LSKYKVYELAKELQVNSKDVLEVLKNANQELKSHLNAMNDEQERIVRSKFGRAANVENKVENKTEEKVSQTGEVKREIRTENKNGPNSQQDGRKSYDGNRPKSDKPRSDRPQRDGQRQYDGQKNYDGNRQRGDRPQRDGQRQYDGQRNYDGNRQRGDRPQRDGQRQYDGQRNYDVNRQRGDRPQRDGQRQYDGQKNYDVNRQRGDRPQRDGQRQYDGQKNYDGNRQRGDRPQKGQGGQRNRNEGDEYRKPQQQRSQQRSKTMEEPMLKKPGSDRAKERERDKDKDKERDKNRQKGFNGGKPGNQQHKGMRDLSQPQHRKPQKKQKQERVEEEVFDPSQIVINVPITVKGFAEEIDKSSAEVIMKLMGMGVMATINQNIDEDTVLMLADEFGVEVTIGNVDEEIVEEGIDTHEDREDELVPRPPIITVMGHVDHGKTSLLDAIRKTSVTATESGGITQHIGASEVYSNGNKIVCLDTPGHEAFTAMRARGAQVTDIAILVVAADDSVKPQTIEAISHAKAAGVPIIVAINKIDKPEANPEKVKQDLMQYEILVEDYGGETISVPVSAKRGDGIDNLLEMVLLQADMLELKANPNRAAKGTVVEARLDKAKGPVATVIVQKGTLQIGQPIVAGVCSGRVRAMTNWKGEPIKKAGPSTAVEILGLQDVPEAGDEVDAVRDEKAAKTIATNRLTKLREETIKEKSRVSLEDLFSQIQKGDTKELNIIVKADVMGSVGAVTESLTKLSNEEVTVKVVYSGVGTVTESDILLATASNAVIIGFNVRPPANIISMAERENIEIHTYRIIYEAIADIKAAMIGMLDPEYKEVVLGRIEIRTTFKVPGVGTVGGAYVLDGKVQRNAQIRLVRDGIVIHEGKISSLKRFKDDAKEVMQGYECGIGIESYNDIKEGDVIEAFAMEEIERKQELK